MLPQRKHENEAKVEHVYKGVLKERRGHVTEKSVLQLVVIPHSTRKMESTFFNFR